MIDYYAVFGLTPSATMIELHTAYIQLASKYHPDRAGGDAAKFVELTMAKVVLFDSETRRAYDDQRRALLTPCYMCNGEGTIVKQRGYHAKKRVTCPECNGTAYTP
jgi:DnaJ-class molecular chaperone